MTPVEDRFSPTYEFEILKVDKVKDGDTIVCSYKLPFGLAELKADIRFADIDVWESRRGKGRDALHVQKGKDAKQFLVELLHADSKGRSWKRRWLRSHKAGKVRGNFGRYLFEVFLDDVDDNTFSVSQALREAGYEKQK